MPLRVASTVPGSLRLCPVRVAWTYNAMSRYFNGVFVEHKYSGIAGRFAAAENMCMQHSAFLSETDICTHALVYLCWTCLTCAETGDTQCFRSSKFVKPKCGWPT